MSDHCKKEDQEPKVAKESTENDEDLDALLDNALEDFNKPVVKKPSAVTIDSSEAHTSGVARPSASLSGDPAVENASAAFAQFEETMRSFFDEDPAFKEHMQKLTDASKTGSKSGDEEFAASLADTLKNLADNAQSISGNNPSEEEVGRLLRNLGIGEGSNDGAVPDLLPLMHNVMQSLLSKELLYPALRDIVDKYPEWLAHNRSELEEGAYDKYNQQYDLMKQVCDEFESEKDEDPDDLKKTRFQRILQLMQKMQECGQPPKDLVGDLGPGLETDEQGNVKLPGLPEQCSLM